MPNFCKLIILGHLSQEPELRVLQSGMEVCNCSIAFNNKSKDKQEVCFVPLTLFGDTAKRFNDWFKKGAAVLVEGRLRQENWKDKDSGANRSKLSMTVDRFESLSTKAENEAVASKATGDATPRVRNDPRDDSGDPIPF